MEDDDLDPRIHIELEKLNNATNDINRWEKELDDSQSEFRLLLSSRTAELNRLIQKFGTSIELSRPFYVALQEAKDSHKRLHDVTINYQRANVVHDEAKKRLGNTEKSIEKLKNGEEKVKNSDSGFDDGLQEILNIATLKVSETSKTKQDYSILHKKLTDEFTRCEKDVYNLEKKLYKHITKSQPYFELKDKLNDELNSIKCRIQKIQSNLIQSKCDYAQALKLLELISEEIHYQRKQASPKNNNISLQNQNNINNNSNSNTNNNNIDITNNNSNNINNISNTISNNHHSH